MYLFIHQLFDSPAISFLLRFLSLNFLFTGIGYEILVDMLKYIAPSHVVKLNISKERKNLPPGTFWLDEDHDVLVNLIEISSAYQDALNQS